MGTYYNLPDERRDEIKKEAARFYEAWTAEESARLVQELSVFRDALLGLARIAHDHGRSVGAIISHADKLGLCHITNI